MRSLTLKAGLRAITKFRPLRKLTCTSNQTNRETLEYDVVIVGAGPAGLSAAIRLRQLAATTNSDVSVCVLEKGSEVGAHVLSGNVFEPRAMDELIPDWIERGAPHGVPATEDSFAFLTQNSSFRLPTPPQMMNHGNYILSLSELCRWLADQAEELGVEIYPGFAAADLLLDDKGSSVLGVTTNDFGVAKDGSRKSSYEPGMNITGKVTLLAEGTRGSLSKRAINLYNLSRESAHQTYALGLKEVWRIDSEKHEPGKVFHSIGYPMDSETYGGSFLYHMAQNRVSVGFVVALDYKNPFLSPYQEFQRFKAHPSIRTLFEGGEVLQYGARTLNEGGLQSIPKLEFPGGAIIGCSAGFVNVPKIKGTHTAQKSGMVAADAIIHNLNTNSELSAMGYEKSLQESWVWSELERVRNIRPGFNSGLLPGLINAAFETYVSRGSSPWTLSHGHADHESTEPARQHKPITYPKADGAVTFDILTSLSLSGTNHDHDEPTHLFVKDKAVPTEVNLATYGGPEQRYCPARVYEYVEGEEGKTMLQINAQNCLHCKACDIKDPLQNIEWKTPQGGGGPKYTVT